MTRIGYTLMCEQTGPKELVRDAQDAEQCGYEFAVISDHYFPWVDAMGHSPYAWSVLGAVAHATDRMELMTYVTCPIKRYHPAVVAQKAATVALLSDGRFTLGLGAGENLNEHVVGGGWPPVNTRHEMLAEAIDIIRGLWSGNYFNYRGRHFEVDSARLWDVPSEPPKLGLAVSGPQSVALAAAQADVMIAVEPQADLVTEFDRRAGAGRPKVAQMPIAYDPDRDAAVRRALDTFAWFGGGWKVNAELPGPAAFEAASQFVGSDDITGSIPCGDSVEDVVAAVKKFSDAGFTDVALCQIGGRQQHDFICWSDKELLPALREL